MGQLASEEEQNMRSLLLDHRIISSEKDRRINAIISPLFSQLEMLIQALRGLSKRNLTLSTERNIASERSSWTGQRSDMVTGATRYPRSDMTTEITTNPFDEWDTQHCYNTRSSVGNTTYRRLHHIALEDASSGESDDHMDQVRAAIIYLPRRLKTPYDASRDETATIPSTGF